MIKSFGAKNFGCFKEQVDISFENKGEIANTLCIEGANGSGKTTVLKILEFINIFNTDSFTKFEANSPINITPHFRSKAPIYLYINFIYKNIDYKYELTVKNYEVAKEILFRKKTPKSRFYTVFRREGNEIISTLKEFDNLKTMNLRSNASVISTAKQYNFKIDDLHYFFNDITSNISIKQGYTERHLSDSYKELSEFLHKRPKYTKIIEEVLKASDLGITALEIDELDVEGEKVYFPVFHHGDSGVLGFNSESKGTQTLFMSLTPYVITKVYGGILVHDEFDAHLHHLLLPRIMDLINRNDAQFIFTTFNIDIMDSMGKYKTYIVEKEDNESYAYRLDEIKGLRNDRPISSYYKKGLLGGVPK